MTDGRIGLDDPAAKYIPHWRGDPRKSRITLRQLGLIVVRNGSALANVEPTPQSYHGAYAQFLFGPLMDAMTDHNQRWPLQNQYQ